MKEFILILRSTPPTAPRDDADMQKEMEAWKKWFATLRSEGSLVDAGNPVGHEGCKVTNNGIQPGTPDGDNNMIFHVMKVQANSLDAAAEIARSCPSIANASFDANASMEVREIYPNPAA